LDATASDSVGGVSLSVPGTFTYTPPAGTILSAGAGQVLAVTFTPTDTTDYTTATLSSHINVNPGIPPIPLVTVSGVQIVTVHLSKTKTATDIVITFSGALDPAEADTLGNYQLAAPGKGKKSKTYGKRIGLRSAVYGPTPARVTLQLSGKLALSPPPQLRITAAGIVDAFGRALDGNGGGQAGGDYVALLKKGGAQPQILRGAESFVRRTPRFLTRP
jgi:hypothetical protein